jgi:transposase
MERAVERGLARRQAQEIPQLGVDEKAFRKGHKYLTLVNDLKQNRVLYVAEDREQSSLDGFWSTITAEQRGSIQAVALDMWDPYVASVREHLPEAEKKIVFDKFHIAKHLGEAVDRVRRREHKVLKAEGDERLTGTKYDWLRNPAAMDSERKRGFAELRQSELKTARAWALKETAMDLYNYVYEKPARKHFHWWYNWAVRSRLQPVKEVASMLKRRFENIITYLRHRITNAASESLNAKIQWAKYTARGFRNKQNFIHAIYFHPDCAKGLRIIFCPIHKNVLGQRADIFPGQIFSACCFLLSVMLEPKSASRIIDGEPMCNDCFLGQPLFIPKKHAQKPVDERSHTP